MKLKESDIEYIESSFKTICEHSELFAETFYDCLFDLSPILIPMFKKDRSIQVKHFIMLLISAVHNIRREDEHDKLLRDLGKKHRNHGVKIEHFPVVKSAFMLALQYEFKSEFTPEIERAWSNYYDYLSEAMIVGLTAGNE